MLYRFVLLLNPFRFTPSAPTDLCHSQARELVSPRHRDPLGMRVAELLRQYGVLGTILMSSTMALDGA